MRGKGRGGEKSIALLPGQHTIWKIPGTHPVRRLEEKKRMYEGFYLDKKGEKGGEVFVKALPQGDYTNFRAVTQRLISWHLKEKM